MKEIFSYSIFSIRRIFEENTDFQEQGFVNSITNSSDECEPGSLFVPLKGNRDGHEFIPFALQKGASIFLCEKNHPILHSLSESDRKKAIFVNNTLLALGRLAEFHRDRFNPFLIAITGSSGKTTTKEFFRYALSYLGEDRVVASDKNYNNEIGVPFTLFKINEKTKVVVCEMGMNHRYEISRLTKMAKPDISLITSIGPAHIENLGSVQNIARAKMEIIEGMRKGFLFLPENIEEMEIVEQLINQSSIELIRYSLPASPHIKILKEKSDGYSLNILGKELEWSIPGEKILWNLAGVLHALTFSGFSIEGIFEGISKFKPEDKRNVWIYKHFHIFDDTYNANPDSMKSSLDSLAQAGKTAKTYAILGDMKELGSFSEEYHRAVGKHAGQIGISGLFSFGTESRWMKEGFLNEMGNQKIYQHFPASELGLEELIDFLKKNVEKDSFLLVKGSRSMKMERIVDRIMKEFS